MLDLKGRTVSTNTTNILDILGSKLGSGINIGTSEILGQFGLSRLQSIYETGTTKFRLSPDSLANIKLSERVLQNRDRQITSDPVKMECQRLYGNAKKSIVWIESTGYVDLSTLRQGNFELGSHATAGAGFKFNAQVNFRRLEPYESPSGSPPRGVSLEHALSLPISANVAAQMPPGSEFELSAEGLGALQVSYRLGFQNIEKMSFSIVTQKLPEPGKVSVRLTESTQTENALGFRKEIPASDTSFIGKIGRYVLQYLDILKWFDSGLFIFDASRQNSFRLHKNYIFDLSKQNEAEAFEDIFLKCSFEKATQLKSTKIGSENETGYSFRTGAKFGSWELSLFKLSESEKKSQFGTKFYQHCISAKEYIWSWLSKIRLVWDWISLEGTNQKSQKSFCHFNLDTCDSSDFFTLTETLEIPVSQTAQETFANDINTEAHVDLFMKHDGIRKVQLSSFKDAFYAHLNKNASSITNFQAAYRYGQLRNSSWLTRWYHSREIESLQSQYPELKRLSAEIQNAYWFGRNTHPFKGSLRRFSDIESIAALMRLAGRDQVIIHELSISRPGMTLSLPDEGNILNPEQEFAADLAANGCLEDCEPAAS